MYHAILYTLGDPQPLQKESGPLETGKENCEGQVRRFGGFLAFFFCLQCIPLVE